jgi:hypothetical protein
MEIKNILIATSLFCNQKKWPSLLGAIQGFNTTIYKKPSYCLEFNYASGQNIRFSFLVNQHAADEVLQQTDHYFKNFFRGTKTEVARPNGEIFKAFDENNIFYGLYDPIVVRKGTLTNYSLQFTLSKYIIAALKNEDYLDDETILTLAYYFSVTVLKMAVQHLPLKKSMLIASFKKRYYQSELFDIKLIQAKFKENKAILLEIFHGVGTTDTPQFIRKWESYIVKLISTWRKEQLQTKIFSLIDQIEIQLGLNQAMKSMLYYFIFRTLSAKTELPAN